MKKFLLVLNFTFLIFNSAFSQPGEWVWIKGDSISNQAGNYGVQGVPSPTNNPPSIYEPCEWTDLNGNFWLFGGYHLTGSYGDLWKYDPLANEWTWIKGTGLLNDTGNYGTQGVPAPTNLPPARCTNSSWVDSTGNLWLFGGFPGYSDLWKYDILTNEWTWMKGPNIIGQAGIYGVQGVPATNNMPGGRSECATTWTDNSGYLWLFGGYNASPRFNDLWRFNITSNEWTWMKGDSTMNAIGYYGTMGIEDPSNTPGARAGYGHWKDNTGNFWLFAGFDGGPFFNDLWRYNPLSGNWTWIKGDSVASMSSGSYGTKCISANANLPGVRFENRVNWLDHHGNFWTFGGAKSPSIQNVTNDVWMYCISTNQWIWQNGDNFLNPAGSWGTLGISSPTNKPNGRGGAVGWTNDNVHLYLFGGFGYYNDLWKYTIDTTCGACPTSTAIQENNPLKADELIVFPNPTNFSLSISFQSSENQNCELRIYNTLGKQIYFLKEEITKEKFQKEINVEKLSGGIYFLQLKTKEGLMSRKVIVEHP